jgi:uncharacterized RDD family membrane protein YckC
MDAVSDSSVPSGPTEPAIPPPPKRWGGFWRRLWAYQLDLVIVWVIYLVFLSLGIAANELADGRFFDLELLIRRGSPLVVSLWFVIYLLYFGSFVQWGGQTPGKMLFGLKVVTADGSPVTMGRAVLRVGGYFLSSFFLLGFLLIAFHREKRGLHDLLSGTWVVRIRF